MATATVMRITPQKAVELLANNGVNRRLDNRLVERYAAAMRRGDWKVNGETIKVGKDGRLLDGQHRLNAVVKSGLSVPIMAAFDVDPDSFDTIDTGKMRSGTDTMHILGYKYAPIMASMARWYLIIQDKVRFNNAKVENHQIREVVEANEELFMRWAKKMSSS